MSIQDDVLTLFREEIPGYLDENWKEVPLELDSDLFDAPVMTYTTHYESTGRCLILIYRR